VSTVVRNTVMNLLNRVKDRFQTTGSAKTKLFLTCLNPHCYTASAQWFKRLKKNITRFCFERRKITGQRGDFICSPMYLQHVCEMAKAYTLVTSTVENAQSKFVIICA